MTWRAARILRGRKRMVLVSRISVVAIVVLLVAAAAIAGYSYGYAMGWISGWVGL